MAPARSDDLLALIGPLVILRPAPFDQRPIPRLRTDALQNQPAPQVPGASPDGCRRVDRSVIVAENRNGDSGGAGAFCCRRAGRAEAR
jgi:hypothetical protein